MRGKGAGIGPGEDETVLVPDFDNDAVALRALLADRARLALLNEATEQIGTSLDLGATCAELARFAVPRFADLASVEILPPEALPTEATVGTGPLRMRRTALEVVSTLLPGTETSPAPAEWVRHQRGCPTAQCLESGQAFLSHQRSGRQGRESAEDWSCEVGTGAGAASVLIVPLRAGGLPIGVLSLLRAAPSAAFDDDTEAIQAVADRAARGIDNARRYAVAQDLTMALQGALLADPGSPHANVDLASRYLPCGTSAMVGGDWFETIRLSFGRTLLVIGDVMGHGVEAAVDMSAYRTLLRYVAATDLPPHRILRQLDHLTARSDATRPATCLLALVEPARQRCTFASAGHPPPTLLRPDGPAALLSVPTGPPLGTGLGDYEAVVHSLDPEQVLLLYTDGLVERRTEDIDASLARLTRLRRPLPGESLEDLLDHVLGTVTPATPDDDIAVLAARIHH
ncbi:GAF domain-containing SpoIIE family protein phosphatase [Streptomyces sp. NPDC051976]|uniref:PP2C family protein-serine/threonine phosphatase n=1 Tax=Streptomyces sp. NPDC051976 TaxID=3154947 RepID=UPI003420BC40